MLLGISLNVCPAAYTYILETVQEPPQGGTTNSALVFRVDYRQCLVFFPHPGYVRRRRTGGALALSTPEDYTSDCLQFQFPIPKMHGKSIYFWWESYLFLVLVVEEGKV